MYLDEGKPLNTIEYRNDESVSKVEFNTLSRQELPEEKRLLKTPLYILTGPWTFSAAEEFTNDLKIHKRATVIGELTGGGANPSRLFQINSVLSVSIPVGKAVNPIEENNWEGVGIIPDYLAPEAEALPKTLEILNELK